MTVVHDDTTVTADTTNLQPAESLPDIGHSSTPDTDPCLDSADLLLSMVSTVVNPQISSKLSGIFMS